MIRIGDVMDDWSSSNEDDEMEGTNGAMVAPEQPTTTQPTTTQPASTDDAWSTTTAGTAPNPAAPTPITPTTTQKEDVDEERYKINGNGGIYPLQ